MNITAIMEYFFNMQKERNKGEFNINYMQNNEETVPKVDSSLVSQAQNDTTAKKEHINKVIKNIPKPKENNNKLEIQPMTKEEFDNRNKSAK